MLADLGRYMPQEFDDKDECLKWLKCKQLGIKRSITLLSKHSDWMIIRVPITNENITIYGEVDEIRWLHLALVRNNMYALK